ncbi:MAG: hypothetical protein AAF299_09560 [Pseudomonadota bacterium]
MPSLFPSETIITWSVFGFGILLVVLMCWRESRPSKSMDVSIWPTTPFLLAGAFLTVLAAVHLFTLYGVSPR